MGLIDKAEKKIRKKVLNEVEDWFEDRIDEVTDTFDDIEEEVKKIRDLANSSHRRLEWYKNGGVIKKIVEDGGNHILSEFKDKITEEMLEGMADALDDAADIIETLAPSRFTLIFGCEVALIIQCEITVSVTIPNPVARLTEIREWADNPPKGRAQIIDCIKDFGPESLGVEGKVSGNGLAAEWDGEEKYDRIDAFLEKHGVK